HQDDGDGRIGEPRHRLQRRVERWILFLAQVAVEPLEHAWVVVRSGDAKDGSLLLVVPAFGLEVVETRAPASSQRRVSRLVLRPVDVPDELVDVVRDRDDLATLEGEPRAEQQMLAVDVLAPGVEGGNAVVRQRTNDPEGRFFQTERPL